MKELKAVKLKTKEFDDVYPKLEGDSPFEKRFNELQSQSWIETGQCFLPDELIKQILIEKYNEDKLSEPLKESK